ncbi:MAG: TolC family protein, partial [Myxococcota bacterium]
PLQVGRLSAERDAAQAELRRARLEQLRVEDAAVADVAAARVELEGALARARVVVQELIPALELRTDATREAWSVGTTEQGAYLEAKRTLILARAQGDAARIEVSRRRLYLQRALGLLPGLPNPKDEVQP